MNIDIDIDVIEGGRLQVAIKKDGGIVFREAATVEVSTKLARDILGAADGRQPKPATVEKGQEWRWLPDKDTRLVVGDRVVDGHVAFFVAYGGATSRVAWSKAMLGDARWQFYGYLHAAPENL